MNYLTPVSRRRNARAFIAAFITYVMLAGQVAPLALAARADAAPPAPKSESVERAPATGGSPALAAPVPQPLVAENGGTNAVVGPAITATKVDTVIAANGVDADPDGIAEPGQIIEYQITITNNGTEATNVTLNDTVDTNTTLQAGTVRATPLARNDAYNVIGNVRIQVPDGASDLLANDQDPDTGNNTGMTATAESKNSANCGSCPTNNVTINADGSFSYDPPPGFTGTDTFTYTASSAGDTSTATVTLTVGNGTSTPGTNVIWFVKADAPSEGDGRLTSPFNCLVGTGCLDPVAADEAGDAIFLFSGTYTDTGALTLLNTQKLIGQGATDTLQTIAGVTVPPHSDALPSTGGTNPTIATTGSVTSILTLGQNNTLRGFTTGDTTGADIVGNTFGTLNIGKSSSPDVIIGGTGQALNLSGGTLAVTGGLSSVTSTSSTLRGLFISGVADSDGAGGGAFSFGSTTISGATQESIIVTASTADINFGNTTVGTASPSTGGTDGVILSNNSAGTRTFGTLTVQNNSGIAFRHLDPDGAGANTGGGTTTITGATTVTNPGGAGVSVDGSTTTVTFAAANITQSGGAGVSYANSSGNLTFADLDIAPDGAVQAISANANTGTLTSTSGTISTTGAAALSITSTPLALVFDSLSAANNGSGATGVSLTTSSGSVSAAAGTITGGTSAAFVVSGGTVSATYAGGISQSNNAALLSVSSGHTGTLTFNTGTLSATGGTGLQFDNADGTYNFNSTTTMNGGDAGVDITNGSGGTFSFGTGTTITNPTGTAFNVNGSAPGVTYSGNISKTSGTGLLVDVTNQTGGTITFQTGTLNATVGTGIQFSNADGTVNFNGTNTLNGGDAGVDIITASDGTFNFSSSTTITSPSGTAFNVNGGTPTVDYNGTLTQNTAGQRVVVVDGTTGDSVRFDGAVSGDNDHTGVNINNANGSVTFAGGLTLGTSVARMTNQAVTITNGTGTYSLGTISIFTNNASGIVATNADGTLNVTTGTVDSSNATAISIDGPGGLTTLGMTLTRVDSAGGTANGITLQDTNGTFTVVGDGSNTAVGGNGSGGTISNKSGANGSATSGNGVFLSNATGVTLRRMTINGTNQNHGIRGVNTSNFTLEFSTVNGTNGDSTGDDEGSVNFDNLTGTAAITSCLIEGGFEENLNVVNTSGTLNRLVITGSTFGFNNTTNGNNNILIESQNAGTTLNFTLQSSTIKGARADWINYSNNSSSVMDAVIGGSTLALGNTFDNLGANAHAGAAAGGNRVVGGAVGVQTVDIQNNTMKGSKGEAIRVRSTATGALTGTVDARVRNNTIGVAGTANSGSSEGSGIFLFVDGGADADVAITNNSIFQYNNHAIRMDVGDEINNGTVVNVTVTGNTASNPGNINTDFNGIQLNNGTVAATDNFTTCADIGGAGALANTLTGSGSGAIFPNNAHIRLRQRQSTTVRLPGYGGANNDDTAVQNYLLARNTATTAAATNTVPTGGGFIGGAACTQPSNGPVTFAESVSVIGQSGSMSTGATRTPRPESVGVKTTAAPTAVAGASSDALPSLNNRLREVVPATRNVANAPKQFELRKTSSGAGLRHTAKDSSGPLVAAEPLSAQRKTAPRTPVSTGGPSQGDVPTTNPPVINGNNISWNLGTLQQGQSVTVTFRVTVNNPYTGGANVSNQGTVTCTECGSSVLTDDPAVAGTSNPTLTPIAVTNIFARDAKQPEPATGTSQMLFTIALSSPASGAVSVSASTADGTATGGASCTTGVDYESISNVTVSFSAGQQIKTVPVNICSDAVADDGETILLNISGASGGTILDAQATGAITANEPGTFIISELRTFGPGGSNDPNDEFVELYNNTNSPITVGASDSSAGWGVYTTSGCDSAPLLLGTIANGTVIPARGHFLLTGSAYSLANYGGTGAAAGNLTLAADIPTNANVAVFSTSDAANLSTATRLDAVGFGTNTGGAICDLMREGATATPPTTNLTSLGQYSILRDMCGKGGSVAAFGPCPAQGNPKDSNDNASDFFMVDPNGTDAGAGQKIGAAGPENLASPIRRDTSGISLPLLDASVSASAPPNRVRNFTADPGNNSSQGTLTIRRRVTNNTGAPITRLRFRIIDLTSFNAPAGVADLRPRTSTTVAGVSVNDPATCSPSAAPCSVTVQGTTLEEPPAQPEGGGFNSTLSAGTITTGTPLANGASINVQFLLGIEQTGNFRFVIIIEALP